MAFDLGFDFRGTLAFVTDPDYAVFVTNTHTYPKTYTAANGYSINAGWNNTNPNAGDMASGNDPRIAGGQWNDATVSNTFRIQLDSGSAPGAGSYNADLAAGLAGFGRSEDVLIVDNTTTLLTVDATTASNHYIDATLTDRTATTTWNGVTASLTFASTTAWVKINTVHTATYNTSIAHFRLALAGPTATVGGSLLLYGLQFDRPASTSGNLTMQADTRAYTLTGQAATLTQTQHLSMLASRGTFFVTGSDAGRSFGNHPLTAATGAFTLTGQDATLTYGHTPPAPLTAATGAFTLTGQAAALTFVQHTYRMTAATGVFTLTGAAVGLVHGPLPPTGRSGPSPYLEYRRHRRMGR